MTSSPQLLGQTRARIRMWTARHADLISVGWLLVGTALLVRAASLADGRGSASAFGSISIVIGLAGLTQRRAPRWQTAYVWTLFAAGAVATAVYIVTSWELLSGPGVVFIVAWLGAASTEKRSRDDRIPAPWSNDTTGAS